MIIGHNDASDNENGMENAESPPGVEVDAMQDDWVAAADVDEDREALPGLNDDDEAAGEGIPTDDAGLQELLGDRLCDSRGHFFVQNPTTPDHSSSSDSDEPDADDVTEAQGPISTSQQHFFQLLEVPSPAQRRRKQDPIIDYTKSIIMTSEDYLRAMEEKARLKEEAERARQMKKKEAEVTKLRRVEEKRSREAAKKKRQEEAAAKKAFNERWSAAAVAAAGDELHRRIKAMIPPLPGQYIGKFLTYCPPICRRNQEIAMARLRAKRQGRAFDPAVQTTPPPWVHRGDPGWVVHASTDEDHD